MMAVTDRHCRYFLRQLAPGVRLYTEMITAPAILHGDRERLLRFDPEEHPLAVQLGGHEPAALAQAARVSEEFGYDEVNLNVGCPSHRVRDGRFGACLMRDADLVARCVEAMRNAVRVPVSVKTRIGVDDDDGYEFLAAFIGRVAAAGCRIFIVHARKALLRGLSPKENREVPPLRYETVYQLKRDFPGLEVILNGGIGTLAEMETHLAHVDGVMLGRKVADDPYFLAGVQERFFPRTAAGAAREAVVRRMYDYLRREEPAGTRLQQVTRPMLGLYRGVPGARSWRRFLSEHGCRAGAPAELLLESLARVGAGG
jgi:tRNA-dihydrouridine synthase A